MKKGGPLCALLLVLLLLLEPFPVPAAAAIAPTTSARSCVLMEAETQSVLYSHGATERLPSASTVKILTALLVLEALPLEKEVEIRPEDTRVEGSSAGLMPGEKRTVKDLLAGLLLASGNDAALALASAAAGDPEAFARRMNERVAELGLENSHFTDPNGLDDVGQYTTAYDLARITLAALKNDAFRELAASRSYSCPGHFYQNHNKLLFLCPGALGVKTGYTCKAGRTLVSLIVREGMELICVTLDDPDDWRDHQALADWAEENYCKQVLCRKGEEYARLPVAAGKADTVSVVADRDLVSLMPKGAVYPARVSLPRFAYAPLEEGQAVGTIKAACGVALLRCNESVDLDEGQRLTRWEELRLLWRRRLGME